MKDNSSYLRIQRFAFGREIFKVALFCLGLLLFGYLILSFSLQDLRFSQFYIPKVQDYEATHLKRLQDAEQFLWELNRTEWRYPANHEKKQLCIGIMTVDRPKRYFLQLMASILSHLSLSEMIRTRIVVLNGEKIFQDLELVSQYVEVFQSTNPDIMAKNREPKMSLDYADLAAKCNGTADYTLILEDDTISREHFVDKMFHRTKDILSSNDYAFIKLFRSEKWTGWNNDDIPLLVLFGIFSSVVWVAIIRRNLRLSKVSLIFLIIYFASISALVPWIIGKQHLFRYPKGLSQPKDFSCCCQAHLYPDSKLPSLISFMRTRAKYLSVDRLIDQWVLESKLKVYVLAPNLFQHVGIFSSRDGLKGQWNEFQDSLTFDREGCGDY